MGDTFNEVGADALPLHNIQVDAFFMDINDVSGQLWITVRAWAAGNGYTGINGGSYAALTHPARLMSWYDAVVWCNARSEKEGLTPVYYTDATKTVVYRATGGTEIFNNHVKWDANGYRLPTEAEWEKAARGGVLGKRYPWGDTVTGGTANYLNSGDPFDNGTTPCGYYNGSQTPAETDMANGYGLYDMAGNVWQWCWDWYDVAQYSQPAANNNPMGPLSGPGRVLRGGAWNTSAPGLACAQRSQTGPSNGSTDLGFRCVRGH